MQVRSTYTLEIVEGLVKQPPGARRDLAPDEIVVAMARPGEVVEACQHSTLITLLSDDERQRLMRFRFERDRILFLVAHALVRMTLSRYANVEPQAWRFRMGRYGRPEIAEPWSRLRFSLSRRHGLAACAVILDRDIGLDVECISRDAPLDVAERFFSSQERATLRGASTEARAGLFMEYWTLKEAYIKARGLGLSLPLDQFSLEKGMDGEWHVTSEYPMHQDPERWRCWSWRVTDDHHQVALVIDQTGRSLGEA